MFLARTSPPLVGGGYRREDPFNYQITSFIDPLNNPLSSRTCDTATYRTMEQITSPQACEENVILPLDNPYKLAQYAELTTLFGFDVKRSPLHPPLLSDTSTSTSPSILEAFTPEANVANKISIVHCEDPLDDLLRFLDDAQTSDLLLMGKNLAAPSQHSGTLGGDDLFLSASCSIQAVQYEDQNTSCGSIPSVDRISTTPPCSLLSPKPIPSRQQSRSELSSVMHSGSGLLSLDFENQKLMEYIDGTDFYKYNLPEPKLGSPEADNILFYLDIIHSATFPPDRIKAGRSLYTLLTDPARYQCMVCGSTKTSAQRAVDCVRAHIGHRPFRCGGWESGCSICRQGQEPARFFSSRLLREHAESAEGRVVCGTW